MLVWVECVCVGVWVYVCMCVCVCPSGMTPCSTPPALMHIWTTNTHLPAHTHLLTHTHTHTYAVPYEGTADRKCPPLRHSPHPDPTSLIFLLLPQSLRTHPGVHFPLLILFYFPPSPLFFLSMVSLPLYEFKALKRGHRLNNGIGTLIMFRV